MRLERILVVIIILSVLLRFLWALFGWGGELIAITLVFIAILGLLGYYFMIIENAFYKIVILYFIVFIIGILFNVFEWKGRGMLLFIGSLGYIIFPLYLLNKKRKNPGSKIFIYSLLLAIVLVTQTVFYIFIHTDVLLTLGHMLSYIVLLACGLLLFGKETESQLSSDEKKIITFIIIANALSLMGVTFKETFYTSIWL